MRHTEINYKDESKYRHTTNTNRIDSAIINYKKIAQTPANSKLAQLPFWLYKESTILLNENNGKKRKVLKLKRGTIVVVDFGVRIGSEISNPHFAIVLTKNDTPYQKNITVLPLSSKNTRYNYPLKHLIYDEFIKHINQEIINFKKEYSTIADELIDTGIDKVINKQQNGKHLSKKDIELLNKYNKYTEVLNNIKKEIQACKKVISFYKAHDKDTYACINQITTISKERIYAPINKYDIVGTAKCSNALLDEIDAIVISTITNFNFQRDQIKI